MNASETVDKFIDKFKLARHLGPKRTVTVMDVVAEELFMRSLDLVKLICAT